MCIRDSRKIFAAIHQQNRRLGTESDVTAFVAANGVDAAKFTEAFRGFGVNSKSNRAKQLSEAYKILSLIHIFLESSLYTSGRVEDTVKRLVAAGKTYEEGGALWLRTTEYGDDKDRVMRKQDGSYTYFVPDVAYHVNKFERGYAKVINVQGTDHHGTVARVRAGLQAVGLGIPAGYPDYVLYKICLLYTSRCV